MTHPTAHCRECNIDIRSRWVRLQVAKTAWHAYRNHPDYFDRMISEDPETVHEGEDAVIVQSRPW